MFSGSAAVVFGSLLVAWRMIILAFSVPSCLLPIPLEVVKVAWRRLPELLASLMISAEAATGGLVASIIFGVLITLIFARSPWARKMFFPYPILLQTVPILAVAPVIDALSLCRSAFGMFAVESLVLVILLPPERAVDPAQK